MKRKSNKGITLIALIITIILMLILAGVVINLTLGENGLLTVANKGKKEYEEASIIEKVEIALAEYNTNKLIIDEDVDVDDALQTLLNNKIFDNILEDDDIGIIKNYEITLIKENDNIVIKDIQITDGSTRIRYSYNQKQYTNEDIEIKITASGNVVKLVKPGDIEELAIDGKIEATYTVKENGKYVFKIQDTEGNIKEEEIVINKIDKLPPKDFTIEVQNTQTGIKVIANTEDSEANDKNAKSGIKKYEYFLRKEDDTQYTKYENNEISIPDNIAYCVYAVAYDNAENETSSKKYVSDYIQNGLILHLDGINNDINGHNAGQSSTWYDMSNSNKNATLYNCIVRNNNIEFNGSSSYATLGSNALGQYGPSTIEVVFKSSGTSGVIIGDNRNVSSRGLAFDSNALSIKVGDTTSVPYTFNLSNSLNEPHTYSVIYDGVNYNNTKAYKDSKSLIRNTLTDGFANSSTYPIIGRRIWASGSTWYFKGNIYSIRVYNKKLTDAQLEQNHEMDKTRFNIN